MTTRMVLIRHGQTVWNREQRFRGRVDIPLDETGLGQARATARYIAARWPMVAVYTSPLTRAVQTARPVASAQGLQAQTMPELIDLDFGECQGKLGSEVHAQYPDTLRAWLEAPHTVHFPGGEGLDEVRERCQRALDIVVERHAGQTVGLVAHAVVNRVFLCAVLAVGNDHFWQLEQEPCAVNLIEWHERGPRLALMNDTSHLWEVEEM